MKKETVDGIEYTTTWIGNQIIDIFPHGEISPLPIHWLRLLQRLAVPKKIPLPN